MRLLGWASIQSEQRVSICSLMPQTAQHGYGTHIRAEVSPRALCIPQGTTGQRRTQTGHVRPTFLLNPGPLPGPQLSDPPPRCPPRRDHATEPIEIVANAFCFSAFSLLCVPFQHLVALGERRKPLSVLLPSPPPQLQPPGPLPPGTRTPARPPHPGLAVRGREASSSFSACSAACGPGRISQILSHTRRKGRRCERGAAF